MPDEELAAASESGAYGERLGLAEAETKTLRTGRRLPAQTKGMTNEQPQHQNEATCRSVFADRNVRHRLAAVTPLIASQNPSKAADMFEINRRIVFPERGINGHLSVGALREVQSKISGRNWK